MNKWNENGRSTNEWIRKRMAWNWKQKKLRFRRTVLHFLTFGVGDGIWY